MKKLKVVLLCGILFLCSCSPSHVAEKALRLVKDGTFFISPTDRFTNNGEFIRAGLLFYDKIFNSAMVMDDDVAYFLKTGKYVRNTIAESSWFDGVCDILFSNYTLIDKTKISFDLRRMDDYNGSLYDNYDDSETIVKAIKSVRSQLKDYQEVGTVATWVDAEDVPGYHFRYNLDNKYIAHIIVLKIPSEGNRVCAFFIESL